MKARFQVVKETNGAYTVFDSWADPKLEEPSVTAFGKGNGESAQNFCRQINGAYGAAMQSGHIFSVTHFVEKFYGVYL